MTTRNILPSKGPAKSMCNRIQGRVGQDQGCNGAVGGEGHSCWHSRHSLTICSISKSMPGHHTRLRARAFILETPGCPPCRSTKTNSWPGGGTTTRSPSSTQPLCTQSSNRLTQKGRRSWSGLSGQPVHMCCSTRDRHGSRRVHWAICVAEIGAVCSLSTISTSSPESGVSNRVSGNGKRLKASALACWLVLRQTIEYSNDASVRAQCWIRPDACDGIALLSLNRVSKGL